MTMTVLSIPEDGINLSGNIPDIKITADQPVSVRLICDGEVLTDESYTPDSNNRISFNINEVVNSVLHFTIPSTDTHLQANLVKSFALELDSELYNFSAIRSGIKILSVTVKQWLAANFLTWQPQEKEVLQKQPEWLTYYATEDCKIIVKAYFNDGTHSENNIANLSEGNAYTINVCYGRINDIFNNKQPVYYDIRVQNNIVELSYIQRFILRHKPAEHNYFAFENSIGGLDVACLTGENIHKPEYEPKSAIIEGLTTDYNTDKADTYSQSTGWLSKDESNWLQDFFASKARYVAADGALLAISMAEAAPEKSNKDDLCAYEFSYKMAKASPYLNSIRNYEALPEDITIINPVNIPFDLAPRLIDFPEILLSDIALLPLQSPFEQKWYRASLGAIKNEIISAVAVSGVGEAAHIHSNLPVLNLLGLNSGYLYSGSEKIKAGFADKSELSDYAYFAEHADTARYALTAGQSENARLWNGHAWDDWLDQPVRTVDAVIHKSLSAAEFVSGFSGFGWQLDEDARLTVDYLTVRKQLDVYALVVNKIRATNGSIWVSDGAKIQSVAIEETLYRCYIDTDAGNNPVPFRESDIIRCQQWTGQNIKYYCAKVDTVNNDNFTLIKSSFDGSGIPASGDEPVRIGSVSDTNRQGAIYLTASDNNAPYIDVIDGVVSSSLAGKTKVRMGKLSGITDVAFGGALSGYGLYSDNVYIKGKIHVTGGNAATISDIDSTLSSAKTYTDALKNGLGAMAWETKVEVAKLGTTVIEGGYIKTNLINANAIKISGGLASIDEVNTAINSIDVGGRNLALNSKHLISNNTYLMATYNFAEKLVENETYTIQIKGALGSSKDFFMAYNSGGSVSLINLTNAPLKNGVYTGIFKAKIGASTNTHLAIYAYPATVTTVSSIEWIKLEKGNKATDWSPAPEDYGDMAYQNVVEFAKLGTTVIEGGYIKTSLINANAIKISGGLASIDEVNNAVNTLQFDTRNLLINSRSKPVSQGTGNSVRNTDGSFTITDSITWNLYNTIISTESGEYYSISIRCKRNSGSGGQIQFYLNSNNPYTPIPGTDALSATYKIYTLSLLTNICHDGTQVHFIFPSGEVQIDWIKIVKGNKPALSWTPALEDFGSLAWDNAVEMAKLGTTVIEGGYINPKCPLELPFTFSNGHH